MIRRVYIILIFLIFVFTICFANIIVASNTLDSLLNALSVYRQDTSQVQTLCEITSLLIDENNQEAKNYALQAVEKSKRITNPEYLNQSLSLYFKAVKNETNTEQQLKFLDQIFLSFKNNEYAKKSMIFLNKGLIYESIDSAIIALSMYDKATQLAIQSQDTLTLINVFTTKGIFYKRKSNYTLSLESFITALKLSEYSGNIDGLFPICINLGTIYEQMHDYDKAIELYKKAEMVIDKENDQNGIAIVNYKIGKILLREFKYKEAESYLNKVYNIHVQRNDRNGLIVSSGALAGISYDLKQYPDFLKWIKISLENAEITQNQQGLASTYSSYGRYYDEVEKDYHKALEFYKKNLSLDFKKLQLSHIYLVYNKIYLLYEKLGDYKKAFEYYKLYSNLNDSLYNSENIKKQTEIKLDYEFDKIQHQKEIENQIKEREQQLLLEKERQSRNFFIVVGILALLLLVLSYRSYRIKRKANLLLAIQKQQIEEKNEELNQQNAEIAAQRDYLGTLNEELEFKNLEIATQKDKIVVIHNELKDSIHYAKQIQEAVLPSKEFIDSILSDYFILFKPCEIVSGDFYWITKTDNIVIIAVADCTGHGVPGAFMSMLGISLMNEIKLKDEIINAGNTLDELRMQMIKSLQQRGISGEQKDGMDMSLLVIKTQIQSDKLQVPSEENDEHLDKSTGSVHRNRTSNVKHQTSNLFEAHWAGANNPLWIVRSSKEMPPFQKVASLGEGAVTQSSGRLLSEVEILSNEPVVRATDQFVLQELKADKMPVAIYENMKSFTNHEISLQKGDVIYLSTDGFQDQFGGSKSKKFLSKKFKQLLLESSNKPMTEQKEILEKTFENWKQNHEQTDDVTVLGIRF
ncbi:MAG: hypothetical protein A2046_00540 [Bacteroidetes bacterium GWA2_30_7]|nr:MAG: hypothetical protein A2046_00540 [Bacteroidetes bacterium GWA2_30_7]